MNKQRSRLDSWLCQPLDKDIKNAVERLRQARGVERVALMPDVHLASDICVGTVVGTRDMIYPQAVGGDIGCGMATMAFEDGASLFTEERNAARVLNAFGRILPILKRKQPAELPLDSDELSAPALRRLAERDGRFQLGTVGRGNHFVELQSDNEGRLWVCVHSGSRAIGRAIMGYYIGKEPKGLVGLTADSAVAQDYLSDMEWALAYARLNRRILLMSAIELIRDLFDLQPLPRTMIECHHNHVRQEKFGDVELWVHRKGAMPASQGEAGIIPGSMGSQTHHVIGRGCEAAMRSSSHGAGRNCSRAGSRKKISTRDLHRQMKGIWFDTRRANALRDEAPRAYRDISKVMRAQKELTKVIRTLTPLLSYKG